MMSFVSVFRRLEKKDRGSHENSRVVEIRKLTERGFIAFEKKLKERKQESFTDKL